MCLNERRKKLIDIVICTHVKMVSCGYDNKRNDCVMTFDAVMKAIRVKASV